MAVMGFVKSGVCRGGTALAGGVADEAGGHHDEPMRIGLGY